MKHPLTQLSRSAPTDLAPLELTREKKVFSDVFHIVMETEGPFVVGAEIIRGDEVVVVIEQSTHRREANALARKLLLTAQEIGFEIKGGLSTLERLIRLLVDRIGTENEQLALFLTENDEEDTSRTPVHNPFDPFAMTPDTDMLPPSEDYPQGCTVLVTSLTAVEVDHYYLIRTQDRRTLIRKLQGTQHGNVFVDQEDSEPFPLKDTHIVGRILAFVTAE